MLQADRPNWLWQRSGSAGQHRSPLPCYGCMFSRKQSLRVNSAKYTTNVYEQAGTKRSQEPILQAQ